MNVFYLDEDPVVAAQYQCDRHVVKMILESAQLLSTAHRVLDGDEGADSHSLYKATHKNHPSAIWCRANVHNYNWLYKHFMALCVEYSYRYGKKHLSETKLAEPLFFHPNGIPLYDNFTAPTPAMPDEYKCDTSLKSYRYYYANAKAANSWFCYNKNRAAPAFLEAYKTAVVPTE